jgi:hypothetical protein
MLVLFHAFPPLIFFFAHTHTHTHTHKHTHSNTHTHTHTHYQIVAAVASLHFLQCAMIHHENNIVSIFLFFIFFFFLFHDPPREEHRNCFPFFSSSFSFCVVVFLSFIFVLLAVEMCHDLLPEYHVCTHTNTHTYICVYIYMEHPLSARALALSLSPLLFFLSFLHFLISWSPTQHIPSPCPPGILSLLFPAVCVSPSMCVCR